MRKLKSILFLVVLAILSALAPTLALAQIDLEARGLITSEKYELKEISTFQDILRQFYNESPDRNIVLFIHGRDEEPSKEFRLLSTLEDRYHVKMIMLRWPSWTNFFSRPVKNAQDTSEELSDIFWQLKDYKQANAHEFRNRKVSVIFYSMGNIILETFTKFNTDSFNSEDGEKLFSNLSLVSADVGLYNHKEWLNRVDFAQNKYVFMNHSDIVLNSSKILDPRYHRLGLGFNAIRRLINDEKEFLADNVNYLDLSGLLLTQHAYYSSSNKKLIEIFTPIFQGDDLDLSRVSASVKNKAGINYLSR